ncbi:MAG TPA: hypothetical protein ENN39_10925 [Desulfonatronum sp.]|nr:hypothetical protein [Desulfonatronum sp.]
MKKHFASWLPVFLSVTAALALSLEYWLQQTGRGGLCPTTGCAVVGTFVRYGEIVFIGLGAVFFWILAGLLFFDKRLEKSWLWMSVGILLAAGLAFDGGILGFQRFGIQESCILCYAVGATLFLILLSYSWARRSLAGVILGVAVWTAGFVSQALFLFPEKTPDLQETVLFTLHDAPSSGPQLYYFFSLHCPFCTHVLASLAVHPPQAGQWNFVPLDTRPDDQRKLSALLDQSRTSGNVFQAVLDIEQASVPDVKISANVVDSTRKGGIFLRNSGYRGVPLLLVQETPSRRVVLQGREPILNYLLEKRLIRFRLFF